MSEQRSLPLALRNRIAGSFPIPLINRKTPALLFPNRKVMRWRPGRVMMTLCLLIIVVFLAGCSGGPNPGATSTPTATPTPLPSPTPPPAITPDQDLAEVIAAANEGDTIYLAAGEFTLAQGLEISKTITLIGAGYDQTTITSNVPLSDVAAMIRNSGSGTLSIEGVKILYAGSDPSAVVYVESGQLILKNCYVEGATVSNQGSQLGAIALDNSAQASIVDCDIAGSVARANPEAPEKIPGGILVYGDSQLVIEDSEIFDSFLGIYAFGNSQVTARHTTFRGTYAGASLLETATGTFEGNSFLDNSNVSLIFFDDSVGTVTGNSFRGSEDSLGIQVNENANVSITQNTIQDIKSGILFLDNTTGEALDNELTNVSNVGIFAEDDASFLLEGNTISDDSYRAIGILLQGNTAGMVRGNQLSNLYLGISVSGQAGPTLESNEIQYCTNGIYYKDESFGVASMNIISMGDVGILINSPAYPTITNNTIQAYYRSIYSDPEDWIDNIPVSDNSLQEGEPEIIIVTVTPQP